MRFMDYYLFNIERERKKKEKDINKNRVYE